VLFKAFFLFIAGVFAFALISVLIGLLFSGMGIMPFRHYLLGGIWQNLMAVLSLVLFLCIPVIALLTWLIRRIIGVRSRNNYLGYIFGTLWTLGWISLIIFITMMVNNFRSRASVENEIALAQPAGGKLIIKAEEGKVNYYGSDWFGFNWDNNDGPFYGLNEDSVMMTTVRINIAKSPDSMYHLHQVKFSRGNSPMTAKNLAGQVQFSSRQADSILYLPRGFAITPAQKFRNQQVLMIIEIPVGKRIVMDENVGDYRWFNIEVNHRNRGWNIDWNDDWDDSFSWSRNVEYTMTENGLKRTDNKVDGNEQQDNNEKPRTEKGGEYRYRNNKDSFPGKNSKSKMKAKESTETIKESSEIIETGKAEPVAMATPKAEAENDPSYLSNIVLTILY
jgi:hypothetical protein